MLPGHTRYARTAFAVVCLAAPIAAEDPLFVLYDRGTAQHNAIIGRIDGYTTGTPVLTEVVRVPAGASGGVVLPGGIGYDASRRRLIVSASNGTSMSSLFELDLTTGSGTPLAPLTPRISSTGEVDVAHDGTAYVVRQHDQEVFRLNLGAGFTSIGAVGFNGLRWARDIVITSDGRALLHDSDTMLRSMDLSTGVIQDIGLTFQWDLSGLDLTSDGRLIGLTRIGRMFELDPNTGATLGYLGFVDGIQAPNASNTAVLIGMTFATEEPLGWSTSCSTSTAALYPRGSGVIGQPFSLLAEGLPADAPAFVLISQFTTASPVASAAYDGALCLAAPITRAYSTLSTASQTGVFSAALDLQQFPSPLGSTTLLPGDARYFQLWYRDTSSAAITSAVHVTFR